MTCWSLPSARPIAFNDCPAFQRLHISARWAEESFHRLACIMNTTFRGETYIRWCCIDQLNRHDLSRPSLPQRESYVGQRYDPQSDADYPSDNAFCKYFLKGRNAKQVGHKHPKECSDDSCD